MLLSLGRTKKDIVRYILIFFILAFGCYYSRYYTYDNVIVYCCIGVAAVFTIKFPGNHKLLGDILLPIYAALVGIYLDHAITCLGHQFFEQYVETHNNRSLFHFMLHQGAHTFIMEFIIILGVYYGVRAIRGSQKVAAIIAPLPTLLLCLTDYYVFQFRTNEMSPMDFINAGTAFNVIGNYTFPIKVPMILVILPFTLFVISIVGIKYPKAKKKQTIIINLKWWVVSVLSLAMLGGCLLAFRHMLRVIKPSHPCKVWGEEPSKFNGYITNFILVIDSLDIKAPADYNKAEYDGITAIPAETIDSDVNIIVIMNESYADLSIYTDFMGSYSEPAMYWESLKGQPNVRTGYAYSSVFGGQTANSEFEALTGLSISSLPLGSIPYSLYIQNPRYSLPEYLRELGYDTYAMHPYDASGWNRPTVYPNLGFNHTYFIDDFNYTEEDIYRGSADLNGGGFISDYCAYENLLDIIDSNNSGNPGFYFLVTIQNHGGYDPAMENLDIMGFAAGTADDTQTNIFLSNIYRSDLALQMLLEELSQSDEKYLVLLFGDHQPSLSLYSSETKESHVGSRKWIVPYILWTNYDAPDGFAGVDLQTSINYMPLDVLSAAEIPYSPYFEKINEVRQKIPMINALGYYSGATGEWHPIADAPADNECKDLIKEYNNLLYYSLFDYKG
ncbi:MAG: LTA synthase family protein [Saccharofermentans sp.]|nr:LTA synthase family protein [Saccharofermentans sp.]